MKRIILGATILLAAAAQAQTYVTKYELTITNGSQMPISPGAVYAKNGAESAVSIGGVATAGFTQLCQTGNVTTRLTELKSQANVKFLTQTTGPILPGQSQTIVVEVANPLTQSLHFEAMYGKSKDVCSVASINSHSLVALKQHVTAAIIQKDDTLLTGSFTNPVLPTGMSYLDTSFCSTAVDAISCLRSLSKPTNGKIHFFAGYSPSFISALENKYGADSVESLIFPTSGAVQIKLTLKH